MAEMSDAQKKRAEARKRRRGKEQAEPADDGKAPASESPGQDAESHQAVKQAAKVAAAGAAVGAAAAAARALTSRDDDEPGEPDDAVEQEAAAPPDDEASAEAEVPQAEARADEGAEPEPEPEHEPEPQPENEPAPERKERDPVAGAEATDARQTIDRAREQLEDLLGRQVETVSSLERTHDGWVVALEVVELSRIPESTDVLASYEMELDEGLNLRRYQQVRRYHRGRADRAEDS